jgi:hypothetical protein
MTRILCIELRRGSALVTALVTAVAAAWFLVTETAQWAGRWTMLTQHFRVALMLLGPLVVAAGAWQAGRDHRNRTGELLRSTARPGWHPLVVAWAAVALGGTLGVLVPYGIAGIVVGRVASYAGGGWWWTAGVGVLALWTLTALGVAVGRLAPFPLVAPIAAVVALGLLGTIVAETEPGNRAALSPVSEFLGETAGWPGWYHAWQAGWLLAIAAALLALAAGQWRGALPPALLAAGLAVVPVLAGPAFGRPRPDPGAAALVCTRSGPAVCLTRVNAYLLDPVAVAVQPMLTRLAGIPGAPVRAVDSAASDGRRSPDALYLSLTDASTVDGHLMNAYRVDSNITSILYPSSCLPGDAVVRRAYEWVMGEAKSDAAEERAWFGAYLAAMRSCDPEALKRLA